MTFSERCVALNRRSEGCSLHAYWDADGKVWTIGWGHTGPEVHEGLVWTQAQCDAQQIMDLQVHADSVEREFSNRTFTQGQFDALTDLFFNVGVTKLRKSAPLTMNAIRNGNDAQVPYQLYHTDHDGSQHGLIFAGGKILPGLVLRRQAEIELWNS